ncbi:glycosyltransferase family 1 protein [Lactobacillus sp. CBA3605]|uniref:glycosyltransferase n=1 Tax=Lactobacillus sp. CBA3605 TaxID=2099788 RepID=UPI000CFC2145|nr:glycosyltransferase [Lactobacillus sp. CBA3605]AVK62242.1 glycosyltransferase family 1 protein [Lactobacillus sp. CBA3605]
MKVMQINLGESFGGVSSMLFNLYSEMDHRKITFDFVAPKKSSFTTKKNRIEAMGGRIIELKTSGNLLQRKWEFFHRLGELIKNQQYQVVHINSGSTLFNIQVAWIAKLCGVPKIIVHSHNAGNDSHVKKLMMSFARPLLEWGPTDYFACSNKAAKYMFTKQRYEKKQYELIKNAVNIKQFEFSKAIRDEYREKLDLVDKDVILHVGRFTQQKNHKFILKVFSEVCQTNNNARLVLVGAGELQDNIKQLANNLGISSKVLFLNLREDVSQLMSMSDLLLLPSLYEGLPVVGVEAQAAGMGCVFSDVITSEVDLTQRNDFISLNSDKTEWAKRINEMLANKNDAVARRVQVKMVMEAGYSLTQVAQDLEKIYENK